MHPRRPQNQPKPNTRFLNNIIRDTNSHNRALLAKESVESQARLRELEQADKEKQREQQRVHRRAQPGPADTRKRILGNIAAFIDPNVRSAVRTAKRRRGDEDDIDTEERTERRKERDRSPKRGPARSGSAARLSTQSSRERGKDLFDTSSSASRRPDGRLRSSKGREQSESNSTLHKYRERSDEKQERRHHRNSGHDREIGRAHV